MCFNFIIILYKIILGLSGGFVLLLPFFYSELILDKRRLALTYVILLLSSLFTCMYVLSC